MRRTVVRATLDLLNIRLFEDPVKSAAYQRQTKAASTSNCPLCALGTNSNRTRIRALSDMEADLVTAWPKGGFTEHDNCEMLCMPHNPSKGNR